MTQSKTKSLQFLTTATALFVSLGVVTNPVAASPAQLTGVPSATTQPTIIAQANNWKELSTGNCAILFPGNPTSKKEKVGEKSVSHTYTVSTDEGWYFLSYLDMSEDVEVPSDLKNTLLDTVIDAFVTETGGKVLEKQRISLNGNPGIGFNFAYKNVPGKGRIYWVGQRAYMLMSVAEDENSQKFFDSFKLLNI